MPMTFQAFTEKWNGRYNNYDGQYGTQCTDLMRQYLKDVHGFAPYIAIPQTGWAKTIFKNFKNNSFFMKILNTPTNMPKQGDLAFWSTYPFITGLAGHVGIVQSADLYTVISFDQNYPTGKPCGFVKHSYRGVLGWLRRT